MCHRPIQQGITQYAGESAPCGGLRLMSYVGTLSTTLKRSQYCTSGNAQERGDQYLASVVQLSTKRRISSLTHEVLRRRLDAAVEVKMLGEGLSPQVQGLKPSCVLLHQPSGPEGFSLVSPTYKRLRIRRAVLTCQGLATNPSAVSQSNDSELPHD